MAAQAPDDTFLIDGPPVLAVEILSPKDKHEEVVEKINAYLESGVALVWIVDPDLRTVTDPYEGEELIAMPALRLDAALVHMNRADERGNAQFLGPDPYFDDLFCLAARKRFVSCEQIVTTAELVEAAPPQAMLLNRMMVDGVVETPNGAHFTMCTPDYERDEKFQKAYVAAASGSDEDWAAFVARFLAEDEAAYQAAVAAFTEEQA